MTSSNEDSVGAAASSGVVIIGANGDEFGEPPPEVHALLDVVALKRRAEALRVQAISARSGGLSIRLRQDTVIDIDRLVELVSERPDLSFSPSGVLTVREVPRDRDIPAEAQAPTPRCRRKPVRRYP